MADPTGITTLPAASAPEPLANGTASHQPYVPADVTDMKEFTWPAVITGTCLGLVFSASSLYLVLKVGMTVSASIPVAVLAITLFRAFSKAFGLRKATILENNVVQTAGSAGESIAFGVGVTMPALLLLGFQMDPLRILVVSVMGGLLGILAMIPLRRAFIVKMHGRPGQPGTLLYPEGTACAQVLISGEKGGTTGATVFVGFGLAFAHKFLTEGMKVLTATVAVPFSFINKAAVFASEMASELLGVGYIIGLRTSAVMMAGAVLGYLVILPLIYFIGEHAPTAIPPGDKPIKDMSLSQLRNNYLLFIGAGCVATAGIISMLRTLPLIVRSVASGLATVRGGGGGRGFLRRTDNDMPMSVVLGGSLGLVALLTVFLTGEVGLVSAVAGGLLVVLFGFLFVTVSSRLTGEIGSSSNPISGMTVATLMITCLIFLALGWTQSRDRLLALSIAAVVCVAASNGGTTAQSLKTGFLVGGTPRLMQWAILVGALVSAVVIGGTLISFNQAGTVYSSKLENLPAFTLSPSEVARLQTTETFKDVEYKVWDARPGKDPLAGVHLKFVPPGVYLVEPKTGKLAFRKPAEGDPRPDVPALVLTPTEVARLTETHVHAGKTYKVWSPRSDVLSRPDPATGYEPRAAVTQDVKDGMYLVDPETGQIAFVMDPAIMGKLEERDDGTRVSREFEAPKTQVMGIVINGVLSQKLNWSMVAIGGMIAVMLELCGVSALAFAVGVYVPIQYSVPIFLGGVVRWAVDRRLAQQSAADVAAAGDDAEARARAEVEAIRKSETSPGVLLASGYIAGGSLAGVVIAFLAFSNTIPKDIARWQYSAAAAARPGTLEQQAAAIARERLGPHAPDAEVEAEAAAIVGLNDDEGTIFEYVRVPAGTILRTPTTNDYKVTDDTTLGVLAEQVMGRRYFAKALYKMNAALADEGVLPAEKKLADMELPAGASLLLPQVLWPAILAFAALIGVLLAVGMGLMFKPREEQSP